MSASATQGGHNESKHSKMSPVRQNSYRDHPKKQWTDGLMSEQLDLSTWQDHMKTTNQAAEADWKQLPPNTY